MVIREQRFSFSRVREALGAVLGQDLHAKRVDSLCDATPGVLHGASLAVCAIGQGLAAARGLIATVPEARLRPLMERCALMLQDQLLFADAFGPV